MPDSRASLPLWLSPLLAFLAAGAWASDPVNYQRLGWETTEQLKLIPPQQRPRVAPACHGAWVTPIPVRARLGDPNSTPIHAAAQNAHYDQSGASVLTGNVTIRQGNREVDADNAEIYQEADQGTFNGNLRILEPGVVMTGQKAFVDFSSQEASVEHAEFVAAQVNAHGRADQIVRNEDGVLTIARGEYSTCDPTDRTWYFVASDIILNQDTGRGTVRDGTLYVKNIPIFYTPYFNFPIDSRRESGILVPRFGNTNDGGFDFALPVYLNLAPNYDATLTPRLMSRRGDMMEGEFRYLLPYGGTGSLNGAFLPSDQLDNGLDRKSLFWRHTGQLSDNLTLNTNINYVSDDNYFTDLGTDLNMANTTVEERTGDLNYRTDYWSLLTRVQSWQTIDPAITDVEKPYARLPELLLNAGKPTPRGWQPSMLVEATNFERQVNDGSGPEINGDRLRMEPALAYLVNAPWGFVKPQAKVRYLADDLTGTGVVDASAHPTVAVPDFSLDSGLTFERDAGKYTQTLEPRAFYLYAPYKNQDDFPLFDTATSTFSYSQLFRDSRFSGGDRLDDANQISLGTTTRFIDPEDGSEQFRASVGEIFYLRDRKINVNTSATGVPTGLIGPAAALPPVTTKVSGIAGETAAQFTHGWGGRTSVLLSPGNSEVNQFSIAANYLPPSHDTLFNIGYNYQREDASLDQQEFRQIQLSFVAPIGANWKFLGLWQYDLIQNQNQDLLAGVEYDSCCYSIRLIQREFLANPPNLTVDPITGVVTGGPEVKRTAFFIEFRLKGLAGVGSSIDSLLGNNVFGYNQLLQHDQQMQREELP